jgi:hypothetical protein
VEHFENGSWVVEDIPSSAGSNWTSLWGVTVADGTAWEVGTFVDPKTDNNDTSWCPVKATTGLRTRVP